MFGLIKKIFKKDDLASPPAPPVTPKFARSASPSQPARPAASPGNPFSNGAPASPAVPALNPTAAVRTPSAPTTGNLPDSVSLPLGTVLAGLAPELQNLFAPNPAPNLEVQFALQGILPQLSSGRVRVAFGELRQACPNGACGSGPEHDAKLIDLPLANILSRISPALLPRKTQRQLMDVPKDVTGLFGAMGETVSAAASVASAPTPAPAPAAKRRSAVPENLENIPSPFSFPGAAAQEATPAPVAQKPAPPSSPGAKRRSAVPDDIENVPSPFSFPGSGTASVARPEPEAAPAEPEPEAEPEEMPKIKFDPGAGLGKAKPVPKPAAPAAPTSVRATPPPSLPASKLQETKDENYITVSLADVAEGWPAPVLAELQELGLGDANLSLPAGQVDLAMRKGKIVFPWKSLRGWTDNETAAAAASSHDDLELTLPLKAVAPKFLALRQPKGRQKKTHVEESIPDLFSGGPEPTPTPAPVPTPAAAQPRTSPPALRVVKPEPEPEPTPAAPAPAPAPARKSPGRISAANPNELVAKTAQLPGVTGALLAMTDGLVVASQLPTPLQGETVAAFLPQIFGRLTQFAGELKLGELSSVMLVMDNCPWIIFRTGKVYFAVVGTPGEALPLPQLTAIVADIKRQNL